MTTERRLDNIDTKPDRLATAVENLLSGIAQISEDMRINRLDLTELKATTQGQPETARRQAETTDRLARIVETLIERNER